MKIAVTGGIGSGKSAILEYAAKRGIKTVSADSVNEGLLTNADYIEKIKTHFPEAVKEGVIDRKTLGNIVFKNNSARKLLNSIAHPLIFKILAEQTGDFIAEVPLLVECNAAKYFDKIILVTAPENVKVYRLKERNGYSDEEIQNRFAAQTTDEYRKKSADYIVVNDGTKAELNEKLKKIFEELGL